MSFRIDDILKKEDSKQSTGEESGYAEFEPGFNMWSKVSVSNHNSILQQTLLNRTYSKAVNDNCDAKILAPWYTCDKVCIPPPSYYDPYMDRATTYSPLYSRPRFWTSYPSTLPLVLPFHYSHYSKRKGGQVRFTANQTDALEKRFNSHKYLSPEDRRVLADSLKLTDRQVKTWFQNRRAKWRRCNVISNSTDTPRENLDDSETESEPRNSTPSSSQNETAIP